MMQVIYSLIVFCACMASLGTSEVVAKVSKPHVLFILVDDLGFNDFPTRSSDLTEKVWPNVANLVPESITIESYYTQPLCTPTRGAFMTGRFPARLGLQVGAASFSFLCVLPEK